MKKLLSLLLLLAPAALAASTPQHVPLPLYAGEALGGVSAPSSVWICESAVSNLTYTQTSNAGNNVWVCKYNGTSWAWTNLGSVVIAPVVPNPPPSTNGGGTPISLQTNGVPNTNQTTLNLQAGSGISLAQNSNGTITITNSGGSSTLSVGTVTSLPAGATPTASITNGVLSLGLPAGTSGTNGVTPLLTLGTVTTLPAGSNAAATITGTSAAPILNLSLPAGSAPALSIGTVTTLPAGSNATASLTGTPAAPVLNIGIPSGAAGSNPNGASLNTAQTWTAAQTFSTSPVVPTPAANDNSTNAADTAFVGSAVAAEATARNTAIGVETSRAQTAESTKATASALTSETSRAEAAEAANTSAVAAATPASVSGVRCSTGAATTDTACTPAMLQASASDPTQNSYYEWQIATGATSGCTVADAGAIKLCINQADTSGTNTLLVSVSGGAYVPAAAGLPASVLPKWLTGVAPSTAGPVSTDGSGNVRLTTLADLTALLNGTYLGVNSFPNASYTGTGDGDVVYGNPNAGKGAGLDLFAQTNYVSFGVHGPSDNWSLGMNKGSYAGNSLGLSYSNNSGSSTTPVSISALSPNGSILVNPDGTTKFQYGIAPTPTAAPAVGSACTQTNGTLLQYTDGRERVCENGLITALVTPATHYGLVATRAVIPHVVSTGNTWSMSRSKHVARQTIPANGLQLVFSNWYGDEVSAGTGTFKTSIEYPVGTFTLCTYGGSTTGTATGAVNITTDSCGPAIPNGATFYVRNLYQNSAGILMTGDQQSTPDDGFLFGTGTPTDDTTSGTIPYGQNAEYAPSAIVGTTTSPTVCLLGSSSVAGQADAPTDSSGDTGTMARWVGPAFAYSKIVSSGGTMAGFLAADTNRIALIKNYCTHVINGYGINDLVAGTSASGLASSRAAFAAAVPGVIVFGNTLPSQLGSSSDYWTSQANQTVTADTTAFNLLERAGIVGETRVIDLQAAVDPLALNKWPISPNLFSTTPYTITANITSGSTAVTGVASTFYLYQGEEISGTGVAAGTTISNITGTGFTLSAAATVTATATTLTPGGFATPDGAHETSSMNMIIAQRLGYAASWIK